MEEEKPGAPPSTETKPKPSSEERISFSFFNLHLEDAFTIDRRMFFRFFVNLEKPFYMDVLRSEYIEYLTLFTDEYSKGMDLEECVCDSVFPVMELTDTMKITINIIEKEGGESVEVEEEFPVYFAQKLIENFKIGGVCEITKND